MTVPCPLNRCCAPPPCPGDFCIHIVDGCGADLAGVSISVVVAAVVVASGTTDGTGRFCFDPSTWIGQTATITISSTAPSPDECYTETATDFTRTEVLACNTTRRYSRLQQLGGDGFPLCVCCETCGGVLIPKRLYIDDPHAWEVNEQQTLSTGTTCVCTVTESTEGVHPWILNWTSLYPSVGHQPAWIASNGFVSYILKCTGTTFSLTKAWTTCACEGYYTLVDFGSGVFLCSTSPWLCTTGAEDTVEADSFTCDPFSAVFTFPAQTVYCRRYEFGVLVEEISCTRPGMTVTVYAP
jgi:hypothetical protein